MKRQTESMHETWEDQEDGSGSFSCFSHSWQDHCRLRSSDHHHSRFHPSFQILVCELLIKWLQQYSLFVSDRFKILQASYFSQPQQEEERQADMTVKWIHLRNCRVDKQLHSLWRHKWGRKTKRNESQTRKTGTLKINRKLKIFSLISLLRRPIISVCDRQSVIRKRRDWRIHFSSHTNKTVFFMICCTRLLNTYSVDFYCWFPINFLYLFIPKGISNISVKIADKKDLDDSLKPPTIILSVNDSVTDLTLLTQIVPSSFSWKLIDWLLMFLM